MRKEKNMTNEKFISILMADRYTRKEADGRLHDGTVIYESIEEWIQSLKCGGCYSGETAEGARAGEYADIDVVEYEGHEYLVEIAN